MIQTGISSIKRHITVEPFFFQVHCRRQVAFLAEQEHTRLLQASWTLRGVNPPFVFGQCGRFASVFSQEVKERFT
jgi:hypothetical protein